MFIVCTISHTQVLSVKDLTIDHKKDPVGIEVLQPRFSWKIEGPVRNIMQTAYSIRVATDEKFSSAKIIWQSGKVQSDQSILVPYNGPELKSGQRYYWQVKITDNKKNESKWSEPAFWEMEYMVLNFPILFQTGQKILHCLQTENRL